MKPSFALRRPVVVLCSLLVLTGCESTKSTAPSAQSENQTQPAAPVGNPNAAYAVVSKELKRDPDNKKLQQAQQQYGTRTVDQLLAERENIPETNLSVREQILIEAAGYASERSTEVKEALATLRSIREEIMEAFDGAATSGMTVTEALARCAPFAKYAHTDVDIREALLNSAFVTLLESEMRNRATAGQFDGARDLQQTIADAGYADLLRSRMDAAMQEGTRDHLRQQLDQRLAAVTTLSGERAIWATLLGDPAPRLKLALLITGTDDPEVPEEITRDISERLGAMFAIEPIHEGRVPAQPDADVFLVVDVNNTEVATSEHTEDRPSEYVKSYEEVPNPEYEAAFKEWSFARTELDTMQDQYELALKVYEEDKAVLEGPSLVQQYMTAGTGEEAEPELAEELTPVQEATKAKFYIPPPQPPNTTRHALATRRLENTPRKVRQPVYQEYNYSARIVDARFEAVADLEVFDRLSAAVETADDISYVHERSWTQTTGVHVRDTNHALGDLTEESLRFEKEVFLDGFASTCVDKIRELLSARALEILRTAVSQQQSAGLAFGLAMYAAAQDTAKFELSTSEILEFAESFSQIDASSPAWRLAGLAHVIHRGTLESTVPLDTAARLIELPSAPVTPPTPSPGERLRRHADS